MKKSCALALHSLAPLRMSAVPHGMSWEAADRQAWNRLCVKALFSDPGETRPPTIPTRSCPPAQKYRPEVAPTKVSNMVQNSPKSFLNHSWTILGPFLDMSGPSV